MQQSGHINISAELHIINVRLDGGSAKGAWSIQRSTFNLTHITLWIMVLSTCMWNRCVSISQLNMVLVTKASNFNGYMEGYSWRMWQKTLHLSQKEKYSTLVCKFIVIISSQENGYLVWQNHKTTPHVVRTTILHYIYLVKSNFVLMLFFELSSWICCLWLSFIFIYPYYWV